MWFSPAFTPATTLTTIKCLRRAQIDRADDVMRELGIESFASRVFGHLSTGEQRRFLLGRALVHDPPVLVLDEPTSGLDLKSCFQYLDLVRTQIRKGKTVVLVTHHLHEIPPEIDRVIFLKGGQIHADGLKSSLLTDTTTQHPVRPAASFSPKPTAGTRRCRGDSLSEARLLAWCAWVLKVAFVVFQVVLSPSQRHGECQICIDAADFDADLLPGFGPFDQIILQMGGILNISVVHRNDDVVFLNACDLAGSARLAPPCATWYRP